MLETGFIEGRKRCAVPTSGHAAHQRSLWLRCSDWTNRLPLIASKPRRRSKERRVELTKHSHPALTLHAYKSCVYMLCYVQVNECSNEKNNMQLTLAHALIEEFY